METFYLVMMPPKDVIGDICPQIDYNQKPIKMCK